jgi:hypothetical protein
MWHDEHNTSFPYHLALLHYPLERIGPSGYCLQQPSVQIASHSRLSIACNRAVIVRGQIVYTSNLIKHPTTSTTQGMTIRHASPALFSAPSSAPAIKRCEASILSTTSFKPPYTKSSRTPRCSRSPTPKTLSPIFGRIQDGRGGLSAGQLGFGPPSIVTCCARVRLLFMLRDSLVTFFSVTASPPSSSIPSTDKFLVDDEITQETKSRQCLQVKFHSDLVDAHIREFTMRSRGSSFHKLMASADQRSGPVWANVSLVSLINCNISVPKAFGSAEVCSPSSGREVWSEWIWSVSTPLFDDRFPPILTSPFWERRIFRSEMSSWFRQLDQMNRIPASTYCS